MVTDEMVVAAHRQLPGISNRVRVRRAVEAAVALLPDPQRPVDLPVTAHIHLQIDQEQLHAETVAAIERWRAGYPSDEQGRMVLATYDAALPGDEPYVTPEGLEGPGVTDATGQSPITISEPELNPALARPLELGSLADIARRRGVARSTVTGWVKNRGDRKSVV